MVEKRRINDCVLPPKPQFRFFKYIDHRGKWGRIKKKIRNAQQLQNYFDKRRIFVKDLYCSVGYFLNPQRVSVKFKRETGSLNDFLILSSDFLFDIDTKDFEMFKKGIKILRDTFYFKKFEMCETPRGYQCRVCDFDNRLKLMEIDKRHYSNRYHYIQQTMKELVIVLKNCGIEFDNKVHDPMRVCRVRNYTSAKLKLIRIINERELGLDIPSNDKSHPIKQDEGTMCSLGIGDARSPDKPHLVNTTKKIGGI